MLFDPSIFIDEAIRYLILEEAYLEVVVVCVMSYLYVFAIAQRYHETGSLRHRPMLRGLVREEFLGLLLNYDAACID